MMRRECRRYGLLMWPMWNAESVTGDSLIRFPIYAAVAYGADGYWSFCYGNGSYVRRGHYRTPANVQAGTTTMYPVVKKANWRIRAWASRLIGTRSLGLFSSNGAAEAEKPGVGKLVEEMSDSALVGVLAGDGQPPMAMIVDARVSRRLGKPGTRSLEVRFGKAVRSVTLLATPDRNIDRVVQGNRVELDLDTGEGQLIVLNGGNDLKSILPKPPPLPRRVVNLTTGKPVRSSGPAHGSFPLRNLVDGWATKESSWWSAGPTPVWVEIDLRKVVTLASIRVFPYWGDGRYYQYRVELSTDGHAWSCVADMSRNTTPATAKGVLHRFAPCPARFIRVNVLKNSANRNAHLAEIRAFTSH